MRSWDYKSLQKVVFDSIPGHDFSRHADPVSSVHCKTNSDVGRKSPQDHRGVSFIPGPPSYSLASSSGPPFVPYSSGEGWDVKDAISPDSPQVQIGLSRRVASHPLASPSRPPVFSDSSRLWRDDQDEASPALPQGPV